VHDVAASDDEDAALVQRNKLCTELEVGVEISLRMNRQLHHRNVRLRKRMEEDGPTTLGSVAEQTAGRPVLVIPA
jgi:hypothetical protein